MNVAKIQTLAESGDLQGAHQALDNLLDIGPNNLAALKLRAQLLGITGRFFEESAVWEKISLIARDDDDLMDYLVRRQSEDREHYYFTDAIPGGGKRFLAFPRKMVTAATLGLVGCMTFLIIARLGLKFPIFNHPMVIISGFVGLVLAPWVGIMWSYAKSIRHVTVAMDGFEVATRFKRHHIPRSDVLNVFVAYEDKKNTWNLSVIVTPKDATKPAFEIDLNEKSTPIRARTHFLRELTRFFGEPKYAAKPEIQAQLKDRKIIKA
jgi:hypothetical protein